MKLRIKGDSLRLRLTRSEVSRFAAEGSVEDRIRFAPDRVLTYQLRADEATPYLAAVYNGDVIDVLVPADAAREWCAGEEVTLEGTESGGGIDLRIVVEKDFACRTPREDESDHFPHPRAPGPR